MSINRPKRATPRKSATATTRASSSSALKPPKWKDVVADKPDTAFAAYRQESRFEKDTLIAHSKFGKGVVVEVDGNKIQILFEEGFRKLLHSTPAS